MKAKLAAIVATLAGTLIAVLAVAQSGTVPQDAAIRKALTERLTTLPKIDEVSKTPLAGLFEVRVGDEVFYTDAEGAYLIRGEILDLKSKRNLTEERIARLTAIDFASLPLKDALVWKTGTGQRKIAVFSDPNCGFCKRFERELVNVKDVTVYTFLIPILGADSQEKSKAVWCAKDATATYRSWMVDGVTPPKALGACDNPIERNIALSRKLRVNGTPAIVFENGVRVPGMLTAPQLEQQFASVAKN